MDVVGILRTYGNNKINGCSSTSRVSNSQYGFKCVDPSLSSPKLESVGPKSVLKIDDTR